MRLLLINPRFPESFWSFKWAVDTLMPTKRAINPPLGLATLAALCPPEWDVEIIDENIESIPLAPDVDVVGVCGMGVQFEHQKELLEFYKQQGLYVVAGGSFASLCPEQYEGLADTVVAGEAEYVWKEFCRDYQGGRPRQLYQESGLVYLEDSPTPRFDLLRLDKYQAVSLQYSRGCPFQCEFCDIIVMFGRTPRAKSVEQIGRELDVLRRNKISRVFFVDDNLIGNKRAAKDLMRFLIAYQRDHDYQFYFGTEASVNLAYDHELLELFRDANFGWVFLGIESPEEEALKETKKLQNVARDLLESVRTIYSYGIDVLAGFIVGFDSDTPETFDRQFRFIMRSGIQAAMIGLLTALPKTPLYARLKKEGRLISHAENSDNTKLGTNIVPKQMRYDEMVAGFQRLYERLFEDRNIASRIRSKTRYFRDLVHKEKVPSGELFRLLARFSVSGLMPGGPRRLFHFLRSLPLRAPRLVPFAVHEWVTALTLRDYTRRHFGHEAEREGLATRRHAGVFKKAFARYLREGALELSIQNVANARTQLSLIMHGALDRHFFSRTTRHLKRVLRDGKLSVTLRIGEFSDQECRHLQRLLRRLAPYGDRIYVAISGKLAQAIRIDSSVFNLMLSS